MADLPDLDLFGCDWEEEDNWFGVTTTSAVVTGLWLFDFVVLFVSEWDRIMGAVVKVPGLLLEHGKRGKSSISAGGGEEQGIAWWWWWYMSNADGESKSIEGDEEAILVASCWCCIKEYSDVDVPGNGDASSLACKEADWSELENWVDWRSDNWSK